MSLIQDSASYNSRYNTHNTSTKLNKNFNNDVREEIIASNEPIVQDFDARSTPPIEIFIKCAELLCDCGLFRDFKGGFLSLAGLDSPFNKPRTLFNQLVQAGLVVVSLAVVHQEGRDAVECELGNQA